MGQTYLADPDADGDEARTLRPLQAAAIPCEPRLASWLNLDAGAILDVQIQADNTISARHVQPDARRIRGLLKSAHAAPLTVEQMDDAVSNDLRDKHTPIRASRKSSSRCSAASDIEQNRHLTGE